MVVGVVSFELTLNGCRSLKEKRMVVRSLRDRIRNQFNVSVSETGLQDVPSRGELTVAVVTTDRRRADSVLHKVDHFVESDGRALISGVRREVF